MLASMPTTIVPNRNDVWSTDCFASHERFAAWEAAVSDVFFPWQMLKQSADHFDAHIVTRKLRDLRLIDCRCASVRGQRSTYEIGRTDDAYYCVLLILEGREHLTLDNREVTLNAGEFILWDSEQRMTFTVPDKLHKLTLVVPKTRFNSVLPFAPEFVGMPMNGRAGVGALWAEHLCALKRELRNNQLDDIDGVMQASIELLGQIYAASSGGPLRSMRATSLERAREYIANNLTDESLSPTRIAAAQRISLRYLHILFQGSGYSVSEWIMRERLAKCRELLSSLAGRHYQITEVALRCGFKDSSHFSKAFKRHYGLSPREFRRMLNSARN